MGNKQSRAEELPVLTLGVSLLDKAGPRAFLSPVSIYGALALAANAAGATSTTHSQLMQLLAPAAPAPAAPSTTSKITSALHLGHKDKPEAELNASLSAALTKLTSAAPAAPAKKAAAGSDAAEPDVALTVATSVWAGKLAVDKGYTKSMQALFKAAAKTGTPADINAWVEAETHGKIKDLVDPTQPYDVALCTAVHFKGKWLTAFKKEATQPTPFTLTSGESKQVPMMFAKLDKKSNVKVVVCAKHFTAVRLPYRGEGGFFALALLPEPGTTPQQALKALADHDAAKVTSSPSSVVLSLPRFKADSTLSLVEPLQALGLKDAFAPSSADFSRLVDAASAKGLHITNVAHKAVVEVDEEGTVAAAATAVIMNRCMPMAPADEVTLVFDRPFAFAIFWAGEAQPAGSAAEPAEVGLPLFLGCVEDPSA